MSAAYWRALAAWAAAPHALPEAARARAIDAFIDTVACIHAGRDEPAARAARAISGAGRAQTALRLATAAHALDWDDYDAPSIGHPSAVLVSTVLAFDLTGADAVTAYLVGHEAMNRLGEAMNPAHYERGWHATGTLGAFGAAAAAGHALDLTTDQMLNALSLAAGQAAGLKAQFGTGAKPLNAGFAARTGVTAAELAHAGAISNPETIWGDQGFIALHGPTARQEPTTLPGPDTPLMIEIHGLIAKPHPCCGYLARIIDEMERIAARPGFHPDQIAKLEIVAPARNAAPLRFAAPQSPDEARFSPSYCAAATLATGRLALSDFTGPALARENIRALAARIAFTPSDKPQSNEDLSPSDPDEITIHWRSAQPEHITLRHMRGGPASPLTRADFLAKTQRAGAASLRPLLESFETLRSTAPLREALT